MKGSASERLIAQRKAAMANKGRMPGEVKQSDIIEIGKQAQENFIGFLQVAYSFSQQKETLASKEDVCKFFEVDPNQARVRVGFYPVGEEKKFSSVIPPKGKEPKGDRTLTSKSLGDVQRAQVELQVGKEEAADIFGENSRIIRYIGVRVSDNFTEKEVPTVTVEGLENIKKMNTLMKNGPEALLKGLQEKESDIQKPASSSPGVKVGETPQMGEVSVPKESSVLKKLAEQPTPGTHSEKEAKKKEEKNQGKGIPGI